MSDEEVRAAERELARAPNDRAAWQRLVAVLERSGRDPIRELAPGSIDEEPLASLALGLRRPSMLGWLSVARSLVAIDDSRLEPAIEYAARFLDASFPDWMRVASLHRLAEENGVSLLGAWLAGILEGHAEPRARVVRHLDASGGEFELGDRAFAAAASLEPITCLTLRESRLDKLPRSALSVLPNLRWLDLGGNWIASEDLGQALATPALEVLRLADNRIGPELALDLATAPAFASLRELDLSHNPFGDEGVEALVASANVARLERLVLTGCKIGDPGARAIAASPYLGNLVVLELSENEIGDEGALALENARGLGALRVLGMARNRIERPGLEALAVRAHEGCSFVNIRANSLSRPGVTGPVEAQGWILRHWPLTPKREAPWRKGSRYASDGRNLRSRGHLLPFRSSGANVARGIARRDGPANRPHAEAIARAFAEDRDPRDTIPFLSLSYQDPFVDASRLRAQLFTPEPAGSLRAAILLGEIDAGAARPVLREAARARKLPYHIRLACLTSLARLIDTQVRNERGSLATVGLPSSDGELERAFDRLEALA